MQISSAKMIEAIAYARAMAALADEFAIKRVAKIPSQMRAGEQKVERWQALELTKRHMVGKLRSREMFKTWRLAVDLAALLHSLKESNSAYDELEKERGVGQGLFYNFTRASVCSLQTCVSTGYLVCDSTIRKW